MKQLIVLTTLLFTFLFSIDSVIGQTNDSNHAENPLLGFEQLMGGEWHQDGGYQTFRWGVGKKSVIAENYFVLNGEPQKVSEGIWFWHPGEQQIKGYFTAINMPVEFFDYTTRFTETGFESDLKTYDSSGHSTRYLEKWEFESQDIIKWTLYSVDSEDLTEVMGGRMNRK